eukprot:7381749-Prymnesium_polylepis.3
MFCPANLEGLSPFGRRRLLWPTQNETRHGVEWGFATEAPPRPPVCPLSAPPACLAAVGGSKLYIPTGPGGQRRQGAVARGQQGERGATLDAVVLEGQQQRNGVKKQ